MAEEAADLPLLLENIAPASVSNATSKLDVAGTMGTSAGLKQTFNYSEFINFMQEMG